MNRKYIHLALGMFMAAGVAGNGLAADVYVIANSGTSVSAADVREIFMGEKQFAGAVKIIPVDNVASQEGFLSKVLKMDTAKYAASWTKKAFRDGLSPPASKSADAEVLEYVRRTPGAVGYVSTSPSGSGVTVVQKY